MIQNILKSQRVIPVIAKPNLEVLALLHFRTPLGLGLGLR